MGFKCGIVGLPNVGKSTLFNALTQAGIEAQNYPFCTIEPNVGVVHVPDPRLDKIAAIVNPQRILPTTMEFVDIAGLVKGASQGEGLGNQFLANIRETDAIAHVVRCFENDDIIHVSGKVDPIEDIETIETELLLADMESLNKIKQRLERVARSGQKEAQQEYAVLTALLEHVNQGLPVRSFTPEHESAWEMLSGYHLLTAKPVMYLANVDEQGFEDNPLLDRVRSYAEQQGNAVVVPVCAAIESELASLDPEEAMLFLESMGQNEPGLHRVIRQGYALLNLQTYFTAGEKEVRAWTITRGTKAPQAAAKIHTDFEKGFIRAEVIAYEDFIAHHGESGAKEAGKWRLEGKEYTVVDGDIMTFRFNV